MSLLTTFIVVKEFQAETTNIGTSKCYRNVIGISDLDQGDSEDDEVFVGYFGLTSLPSNQDPPEVQEFYIFVGDPLELPPKQ